MNIRTTSGSGRIVKRQLANGDRSFTMSCVRSMRVNGKPCHLTLAKIMTLKESEFSARAEEFWKIADKKISELVKTNKLWEVDADKVRKQFNGIIPRPASIPKLVEPSNETNLETMKSLIAQIADKAERKLKTERGIPM